MNCRLFRLFSEQAAKLLKNEISFCVSLFKGLKMTEREVKNAILIKSILHFLSLEHIISPEITQNSRKDDGNDPLFLHEQE